MPPKPLSLENVNKAQMDMFAAQVDPAVWIDINKVSLGHSPFSFKGHEYQLGPLQEQAQKQVAKKGAQLGLTETWVLKTLHGMIHGLYPKGSLYLFPTRDDVKDFSKARFDPLIAANPCIAGSVKDTDAANIKKIGTGFLYLRGARATKNIEGSKTSSSQLKSIPVDLVVFDERDEMSDEMVDLALERISHSDVQGEMHLSTPSIPDFGIDKLYTESDQRTWHLKCPVCGKYTCLELTFPECLFERSDGVTIRLCQHCKRGELNPAVGKWIPAYPSRSKDLVGWWISQLNSRYVDPGKILKLYRNPPNGNLAEVMNSKLGMAYIAAENRLTANDVYNRCGSDPMLVDHDGPTCSGVDVGKNLNVVIGCRPNRERLKVLKVAEVSGFDDLHDLNQRFNVKCCVIDKYPETRKCRDFQESERYPVWLCGYQDGKKKGGTFWDEKTREIECNRTEICDATHSLVIDEGCFELPRVTDEIKMYAKQMSNIAKVLDEDEESGAKFYTYKKLGDDHYRHATNYCLLASERIGLVSDRGIISRYLRRRQGRTAMTA